MYKWDKLEINHHLGTLKLGDCGERNLLFWRVGDGLLQSYIPREVRAFIIGVRELSNTFDLLSSFFFGSTFFFFSCLCVLSPQSFFFLIPSSFLLFPFPSFSPSSSRSSLAAAPVDTAFSTAWSHSTSSDVWCPLAIVPCPMTCTCGSLMGVGTCLLFWELPGQHGEHKEHRLGVRQIWTQALPSPLGICHE